MLEQQIILPISTKKELMDFARASNQLHNDQHRNLVVTLTKDINLGGKEWTPIGNENLPFHGTFDGAGHTIRGLHISQNREGCYGLFGAIDGTVKNLTILGTMTCLADDLYSAVGGIAGVVVEGHIQNCTANLTMESNGKKHGLILDGADEKFSLGGIAGVLEGQSNVICCTHNGIADGQWQDTAFPAVGDIIRQMDTEKEHIPQMEQC